MVASPPVAFLCACCKSAGAIRAGAIASAGAQLAVTDLVGAVAISNGGFHNFLCLVVN